MDSILRELRTGEGKYGLVLTRSEEYNGNLELLDIQWNIVLDKIQEVREGRGKEELLSESEILFKIANDTVFSLEDILLTGHPSWDVHFSGVGYMPYFACLLYKELF